MKKFKIILLPTIFLSIFSCSIKNNNIVYFEDYPNSQVWIGDKEINIEPMKSLDGRRRYTRVSLDSVRSKLWAWNLEKDFGHLYLADITNGIYLPEKEICLNTPLKIDAQFIFIYNNKSLIEYRWGLYGIVDLLSHEQNIVDLRKLLDSNTTQGTIGYDEKSILFCNGYYDILESKYYQYSVSLKLPRLISREHKIIGFDENNYIIIYDYLEKNIEKTKIARNAFNSSLNYVASDLYFLEGKNLYIASDTISFENIFIFVPKPAHRKWYKYDLLTNTKEEIYSPSGYSKILGSLAKLEENT
jgi:hypothetical protein